MYRNYIENTGIIRDIPVLYGIYRYYTGNTGTIRDIPVLYGIYRNYTGLSDHRNTNRAGNIPIHRAVTKTYL